MLTLAPEHQRAEGMERTHGEAFAAEPHQPLHAGPHLSGGFVGEGYRQNAAWIDARNLHQVGDAVGDDPGFAASGARHYQERTFGGLYGISLRRVQPLQDIGHGNHGPIIAWLRLISGYG